MKYFTILVAIVVILFLAYYFKPSFIYNEGSVQGAHATATIQNEAMAASAGQAPSGLPMEHKDVVVSPSAGGKGGSVTDLSNGERMIHEETGEKGVPSASQTVDINTKVVASSMDSMNAKANDAELSAVRLASCYPKESLTAEELLPQDEKASQWASIYPSGAGSLKEKNFLQAGHHIGINTVGQTLRNANLQLRSEPPCPQVQVSPWLQSTIEPDLNRRVFEVGSC